MPHAPEPPVQKTCPSSFELVFAELQIAMMMLSVPRGALLSDQQIVVDLPKPLQVGGCHLSSSIDTDALYLQEQSCEC